MTVPTVATYSAAALIAAHTTFKTLVDAAATAGMVRIRSAADVLLAEIPLTDPCGSVNGTTGQLTLTPAGADDSANATGTAAYGEICDGDGTVLLALPAAVGGSAVAGYIVLNTLSIVASGQVSAISVTLG